MKIIFTHTKKTPSVICTYFFFFLVLSQTKQSNSHNTETQLMCNLFSIYDHRGGVDALEAEFQRSTNWTL